MDQTALGFSGFSDTRAWSRWRDRMDIMAVEIDEVTTPAPYYSCATSGRSTARTAEIALSYDGGQWRQSGEMRVSIVRRAQREGQDG